MWENSWLAYLVTGLLLVITCLVFVNFYVYSYWKRHGLIQAKTSFPWGSLGDFVLSKKCIHEVYEEIYKQGDGHPVIGYYSFFTPALVVRDPDLLKSILVRNYDSFSERGVYSNRAIDPLSHHLFSSPGDQHRKMRHVLSPSFSDNKMRYMFETMQACSTKLGEHLCSLVPRGAEGTTLKIKEITNNYGLNVIASTAVGIDHNSFEKENPLADAALKVTDPDDLMQGLRFILSFVSPKIAKFFNMRFTPKGVSDFYIDMVDKIVNYRKSHNVVRKDFMQVLLNLNEEIEKSKESDGREPLSLDEMASQTFLFILAGHETTSASLCFLLYELAVDQEMQQKLYDEIKSVDGDITYETIKELEYMDMIFNEMLRKYPAAPVLIRLCVKDFILPNGFLIRKGTQVMIPVYALQKDPKYFPQPDKFEPERFSKRAPIHEIVPFSFIPFGEGPRYCIGKRFGIASVKLGLIHILSKFKVLPASDTKIPLEIEKKTFVLNPYKDLTLKLVARDT
uniref:Cytochrome P450 CYP6ER1 variant vL n=1 Tax=Nilaparvata lugens TaxID=108931 RepID=A0A2I8B6N6_NILLU|nr:cytochrome P450 CYP6ER1 variant vL [Nilaparvata lugens]